MIDSKDVITLLSALVAFYKKLAAYILASVRTYLWLAILVTCAIIGGRWYQWHSQVPVFESETTFYINNLSRKSYGEMIQKLNVLVHNRSFSSLAKVLNISVADAATLINIEGVNMVGTQLFEDSSPGSGPIYVRVVSSGNHVFEPLQAGLLAYLNSSPFRSMRNQREIETAQRKMEYLKEDIRMIDSVISSYSNYISNALPSKDSVVNLAGIASLMSYKSELEDKLTWTQSFKIKELEHSVELFSGFAVPDNPSKLQRRFPWLIVPAAVAASFLFCFLLNLFADAWKKQSHE